MYFTNSFKGNASNKIAINPEKVVTVFELKDENGEIVTAIHLQTGTTITVTEPMTTVVPMLA